jgi:hypothetical protein
MLARPICVVALCLLLPCAAQAVTLVTPDGRVARPYQGWANASRVPTVNRTVTVIEGRCPIGGPACTSGDGRLWIQPGIPTRRFVLLHELGHQFDYRAMTDPFRAAFEWAIGETDPWRDGTFSSPHEKFAEGYAICAMPPATRGGPMQGGHDYRVTGRQYRYVCDLIRQAARAAKLRRGSTSPSRRR